MKIKFQLLLPLLLVTLGINKTIAQEYFESFHSEDFTYPAYSEYYQDYRNPENSKAFLASYCEGILQYSTHNGLTIQDTIQLGNGYIKAIDFEVLGIGDKEVLAVTTSESEVIIYDVNQKKVIYQTEVNYLLNDIQYSNIDPNILWGGDKRGQLVQINTATKEIKYYPIHEMGIARIELFFDKIITSSFDHTIRVTNQKTLENEQTLKFQVPILEYDVSADGLIALGVARGVALYSLIDEKWLYGKHLTKKKVKVYEGEKAHIWHPYDNEDEYFLGGVLKKVNFIRRSHIIACSGQWDGTELLHVQNPSQIIYPFFEDTIGEAYTNYIFNQDNHLSFLNSDEMRYFVESGEPMPYELPEKADYIKGITDVGGIKYVAMPFPYEIEIQLEDVGEYYPDFNDPEQKFNFIAIDEYSRFSDTTRFEPYLQIADYHFNHQIPFTTAVLDSAEYLFSIEEMGGYEFIDQCGWWNQIIDEIGVDPLCVLETKWLRRDTSSYFKEFGYSYWLSSGFDFQDMRLINVYENLIRQAYIAFDEYKNGFSEELIALQPAVSKNVEKVLSSRSFELYNDQDFVRMEQKGHLSKVESFAISPDQKYLATAGQDSKIILWDFYTGVKLKEIDLGIELGLNQNWRTYDTEWEHGLIELEFHPYHPWIVTSTRERGSACIDYTTGQVIGEGWRYYYGVISDDGEFLIADGEVLMKLPEMYTIDSYEGDFVPESYIRGNNKVLEIRNGKSYQSNIVKDYIDSDIEIIYNNIYELSGGFDQDIWGYGMISPSGRWYAIDSILYDNNNNTCWDLRDYSYDYYDYHPVYELAAFSPDETKFAYMAGKQINVMDLNTMQISTIVDTTVYKFDNPIQFSPDGKYLVSKVWEIQGGELNWLEEANTNRTLGIYDLENMSKLRHHNGHPVEPMRVMMDSTGHHLLFQGNDFIYVLNRENLSIQQLQLEQESKSYNLNFPRTRITLDKENKVVVQGIIDQTYGYGSRWYDFEWYPETGEFRKYFEGELDIDFYASESDIVYKIYDDYQDYTSENFEVWYGQKLVEIYTEKDTNHVVRIDTARYNKIIQDIYDAGEIKVSGSFNYSSDNGQPIAVSPNLDYMYLSNPDHGITKYSLPDMKVLLEWGANEEHLLQILDWQNEMLTISNNGDIILWDMTTNRPAEKLRFYGDKSGLFMITPDNYYSATKENIDFVSFKKGNNFVPISSFDIKYNRPDIILERLNSSDQELIDAYHKAYQKRLIRMGIKESQLDIESSPALQFDNFEHLPKFTNDSIVEVFISSTEKLEGAQLWLNGVPQDIMFKSVGDQASVQVQLVNGLNELEIKGITKSGKNTLPITYMIEKKTTNKKRNNLYVLSIGVSEYADSSFNLNYAAKDARDVSNTFSQLESFDTISSFTLINDDVTHEALPEIKAYLNRADINDVVVIYIAGHGLLDENFYYYYAVYDVDFNAPQEKGWSYTLLEGLLANCKANKKLLIFDTCHGGEIDKEELVQNESDNTSEEEVLFRASKSFKYNDQQSHAGALSKEFFGDFRKGVGATVIASSGGTEYAAESTTYQNGIFTYFLKKALEEDKADLNADNLITVNELRIYLNEEVRKATNGNQNPGTRIINDKHQIVLKRITP